MKYLKVISAGGEVKDGSLVSTSNLSQDEERYVVSNLLLCRRLLEIE